VLLGFDRLKANRFAGNLKGLHAQPGSVWRP
jgi:hypothetical protein